jgi:hypothetical protein
MAKKPVIVDLNPTPYGALSRFADDLESNSDPQAQRFLQLNDGNFHVVTRRYEE